jgi:membrane associated rhomboid family serine protease
VIDRAEIKGHVRGATPFTYALIAINVVVFLAGRSSPELASRLILDFAHHPDLVSAGDWYRLVTAMFLHGSVMHLLFNSWALWLFGAAIERRFGSPSFLALYLASGIAGSTAYQLTGSSFAVGASGAIFGLFGALLAATYRQRYSPAGRAAFGQLAMLLAINLALPLLVPNIAWQAHLGGLVAGAVIAAGWDRLPLTGGGTGGRRVAVAFAVLVVAAAIAILF